MENLAIGGIGALIGALAGWLVWMVMRRPTERLDRAEAQIMDLRDKQVAGVERRLDDHVRHTAEMFEKSAEARKKIYEELQYVRTHFVHVKNCAEAHAVMREHLNQVTAMASRMEALTQRTADALQRGERLLEQVIAIRADLAGVIAQVEEIRHG